MRPKTDNEIEIMREGGQKLARILNDLAAKVEPGISPKYISAMAASAIKNAGMQPVVLGYDGFPDVICISVNEAIVHGIPNNKVIKEGDLVKLDLTLGYKGMVNDSALSVVAGKKPVPADTTRLVEGTKRALDAGIAAIHGEGTRVGDISSAVQNVLDKYRLGVIRELVGHGVGYDIHEPPNIPNYGVAGSGPVLHAGMTIAIEPMASLGDWHIDYGPDKNTIVMKDGSLGAHFEHTVLITEDSAKILTQL